MSLIIHLKVDSPTLTTIPALEISQVNHIARKKSYLTKYLFIKNQTDKERRAIYTVGLHMKHDAVGENKLGKISRDAMVRTIVTYSYIGRREVDRVFV